MAPQPYQTLLRSHQWCSPEWPFAPEKTLVPHHKAANRIQQLWCHVWIGNHIPLKNLEQMSIPWKPHNTFNTRNRTWVKTWLIKLSSWSGWFFVHKNNLLRRVLVANHPILIIFWHLNPFVLPNFSWAPALKPVVAGPWPQIQFSKVKSHTTIALLFKVGSWLPRSYS